MIILPSVEGTEIAERQCTASLRCRNGNLIMEDNVPPAQGDRMETCYERNVFLSCNIRHS